MEWHTVSRLSPHMHETSEGYLVVRDVPIARTGTQIYYEHEVPPLQGDSGGRVHVDRDATEVFKPDSVRSFVGKPICDDHPNEPVGPDNYHELAIGYVANPRRGEAPDDDLLLADMIFTTRRGIQAVKAGKRAISVGYNAYYDQTAPGLGRQKDIHCNHVALVDEGRCGSRCSIMDGFTVWTGDLDDSIKSVTVSTEHHQYALEEGKLRRQVAGLQPNEELQPYAEFSRPEWLTDIDYSPWEDIEHPFGDAEAWNPSEHPRAPAGTSQGGQFTSGGSTTWSSSAPPPKELHGVAFKPWDAPRTSKGWEAEAESHSRGFDAPPPKKIPGKHTSAGVIIKEPSGHVWIVHPTNQFGGYKATFPKGTQDPGLSLRATALKEAFEESGLRVKLTGYAGDVERSTSMTRYYHAERIGGTPAAHGWESEGVTLAHPSELKSYLNTPVDQKMVDDFILPKGGTSAPSTARPKPEITADDFVKQTGKQLGSNPGGRFLHQNGKEYYLKFSKSDDHARNEHLASKLYQEAQAPILDTQLVQGNNGKLATATEWKPGVKLIDRKNKSHLNEAQRHFATHAWLANWDAAGLEYDNQGVVNGKMTTLDPGGSLIFRAQGGPKGEAFGNQANEWDTLRHPSNKQAHAIYGSMSPHQLRDSAQRVVSVPDTVIRSHTMSFGPGTEAQRTALADKLIARKRDIAKRAGITVDSVTTTVQWNPSKHPRAPAGSAHGGEFTKGGAGGGSSGAFPTAPKAGGPNIQSVHAMAQKMHAAGKPNSEIIQAIKNHAPHAHSKGYFNHINTLIVHLGGAQGKTYPPKPKSQKEPEAYEPMSTLGGKAAPAAKQPDKYAQAAQQAAAGAKLPQPHPDSVSQKKLYGYAMHPSWDIDQKISAVEAFPSPSSYAESYKQDLLKALKAQKPQAAPKPAKPDWTAPKGPTQTQAYSLATGGLTKGDKIKTLTSAMIMAKSEADKEYIGSLIEQIQAASAAQAEQQAAKAEQQAQQGLSHTLPEPQNAWQHYFHNQAHKQFGDLKYLQKIAMGGIGSDLKYAQEVLAEVEKAKAKGESGVNPAPSMVKGKSGYVGTASSANILRAKNETFLKYAHDLTDNANDSPNAAHSIAREACPTLEKSFWKSQPAVAVKACAYYVTSKGARAINTYLRTGNLTSDTAKRAITHIDKLFKDKAAPLTKDLMLRRGEEMPEDYLNNLKQQLADGVQCHPQKMGYVSTSAASDPAFGGNVVWEITAKKGTPALGLYAGPGLPSENEVILHHGQNFMIYEIEKQGYKHIIRAVCCE